MSVENGFIDYVGRWQKIKKLPSGREFLCVQRERVYLDALKPVENEDGQHFVYKGSTNDKCKFYVQKSEETGKYRALYVGTFKTELPDSCLSVGEYQKVKHQNELFWVVYGNNRRIYLNDCTHDKSGLYRYKEFFLQKHACMCNYYRVGIIKAE